MGGVWASILPNAATDGMEGVVPRMHPGKRTKAYRTSDNRQKARRGVCLWSRDCAWRLWVALAGPQNVVPAAGGRREPFTSLLIHPTTTPPHTHTHPPPHNAAGKEMETESPSPADDDAGGGTRSGGWKDITQVSPPPQAWILFPIKPTHPPTHPPNTTPHKTRKAGTPPVPWARGK